MMGTLENSDRAASNPGRHNDSDRSAKFWYPIEAEQILPLDLERIVSGHGNYVSSHQSSVEEFEQQFASYLGVADTVLTSSSSAASLLSYYCLAGPAEHRLRPGDEILVPVMSSPTVFSAAIMAGLKVVPVDCDPNTFSIDLEDLRWKISRRTKALCAGHILGNPAKIDAIQQFADERNLLLIESCEGALGCRFAGRLVGSNGCLSLFQLRNGHHRFGSGGGVIACQSKIIADHLRIMRSEGWAGTSQLGKLHSGRCDLDPRSLVVSWGFNAQPTEFQGDLGLYELSKLTESTRRRQEIAREVFDYISRSQYLRMPEVNDGAEPIWDALPLRVVGGLRNKRRQLILELESAGVETRPILAGNIARQPVAHWLGSWQPEDFPGAEQIHRSAFCIGLSPLTDGSIIRRLIETIDSCLNKVSQKISPSISTSISRAA